MKFNYNGLWKMLIDRGMLKKDLMREANLTSSTIAKMGKNQPVTLTVIGRICQALNCSVGEVVDIASASENDE